MRPLHLVPLALLAHATPDLLPRQYQPLNGSTLTSPSALSSAAALLAAQNFPSSLLPDFAIAIQSAAASASVTGDINSLVSSALTAATPPPFFTALPSQYQSRLSVIEKSLSLISSEASAATVIPTSTFRVAVNSTVEVRTITNMGSTFTMSATVAVVNGSTFVVGMNRTTTQNSATTSGSTMAATSSAGGVAASATTSSTKGFAAATKVPLAAAAAGVMGLVGMAALL